MNYKFLDKVNYPSDLRTLSINDLDKVSEELRYYLIETVSQCGGHFGASLGSVELTIALHYSYNTPYDKIVWDVGHQCYGHKVITGRKNELVTIRQKDGLHPFPSRKENEYDTFSVGHSSTSISAALGMSLAGKNSNKNFYTVAVIGDGGLSAGMAYEALNHMGSSDQDILVILNDNEMSISPNVGAMNNYLTKILSSKIYSTVKEGSKSILKQVPPFDKVANKTEGHIKGLFAPGMLFEEMGINYFGPIDGHDTKFLVKTLKNLKKIKGPKLLHVATKKGKGYLPAESDPVKYHAVPKFNKDEGVLKGNNKKYIYSDVFDDWLCKIAENDKRVFAITPAMREGSSLVNFSKSFPERYIDVGIAEQHAVTLAAGLACENQKPIVCIYSTFLQRAYDQLIHDVALQDLDVLFAVDRSGFSGNDGETHTGVFDLSFSRCIPNLIIMTPSCPEICQDMLHTGYLYPGPAIVRYPKESVKELPNKKEFQKIEIGKAKEIIKGKNIVFLCFGTLLDKAKIIAEKYNCSCIDMRFVKPLDEQLIKKYAKVNSLIISIEDNMLAGGAGSAVLEFLSKEEIKIDFLSFGSKDKFPQHASRDEQLINSNISEENIEKLVKEYIKNNNLLSISDSSNIKDD